MACPCTLLPPTVVVEVVMVLCWMTCCCEHAGAGLPAGLLSGPADTGRDTSEDRGVQTQINKAPHKGLKLKVTCKESMINGTRINADQVSLLCKKTTNLYWQIFFK